MVDSMNKSLNGDRSDGHRQGHDRCYIHIEQGVKVNLDCEKDSDGIMQPKLHNGFPVVESIMLMYLELNRKYITEGTRKVVKSGAPVLMTNAIDSVLNARSVGIRALSLKADNFTRFVCDGQEVTPDDLKAAVPTTTTADQYRALLEAVGFEFV
jgi:hypothetical protein